MEAANKGAVEANGVSIGLHIHLPKEQGCNEYVRLRCNFRYFFVRKLMFVKYAKAYVVMPGGMGTIDEILRSFRARPSPPHQALPHHPLQQEILGRPHRLAEEVHGRGRLYHGKGN